MSRCITETEAFFGLRWVYEINSSNDTDLDLGDAVLSHQIHKSNVF